MRRGRAALALFLLAALALGACATASPQDLVGVALRIEKVRAHLLAASENAAAGRWELAAVHAAHPAEDMQPIDSALSKRDAKADAALRGQLIAVREAVAARELGDTIARADEMLAAATRTIAGERADDPAFRIAVGAELLEMTDTEYAEAVVDGALREETEYQDAYAFLTRARALLLADVDTALGTEAAAAHAACEALASAMPGIAPPASPIPAERVEALVDEAQAALAAARAEYATTATNDLSPLLEQLDGASTAIASGDAASAAQAMTAFRGTWTQVEGAVKTRTADGYARIEKELAAATAALAARPADLDAAAGSVARMRAEIAPLAASSATYGVFDAALILLREGVEALLVIAALLAFLVKTGNAEKRAWIWVGGGAGVLASVVIAVVISAAFSASASAGADREVLEGVTGLFAAAMLVYMSWWLHSKATLASWQRYVRERSGAALARNSLLGLAAIAFLAVFREGAETALFYLGMAPSIAMTDLVLGLVIATVGLVAIGILVLAFGLRIPVRPFFLATSVLVYYLAFKFVGTGIHALQVAGTVPASPRPYLPDLGLIGAFPTIETTVVQATLLAAAAAWLVIGRRSAVAAGAAGSR